MESIESTKPRGKYQGDNTHREDLWQLAFSSKRLSVKELSVEVQPLQ